MGVGLLKVLWKIIEAVIDTPVKTDVQFHDILHGFCPHQITRISNMDLKMARNLVSLEQYPLFLVFMDLRKAYDMLDCGSLP